MAHPATQRQTYRVRRGRYKQSAIVRYEEEDLGLIITIHELMSYLAIY